VRGDLGPACNSAGMIDRYILGLDHLYKKPVFRNLKVPYKLSHFFVQWFTTYFDMLILNTLIAKFYNFQECNMSSTGQVSDSSPSWCHAPFDPEGILR